MKHTHVALVASTLLMLSLSAPVLADHPGAGTPTTDYTLNAGSLSCNTSSVGATTPGFGTFAVGAPDHAHVTLNLEVLNNGPLPCWGRIELGTPTWIGAASTVNQADDGECGPITVGATGPGTCTAPAFFAFTRPFHSAGVDLPYCIKYSNDGITFSDPSAGPVCNSFRFIDPPVVEVVGGLDLEDDTLGFDASVFGEKVL